MTSCDLKSCYNRITHVPATMAMHRMGAQIQPAQSMFRTIETAKHTTRTAYGDSILTYGGQENFQAPVMGVGQGNGCGPQVWAAVSSTMFEVMRNKGLTTRLCTPISRQTIELGGFAFVDDTDLFQAAGSHQILNNPEFTVQRMQEAINCWDGVATTTGGAIAADKSWWYLIHFQWKEGR